MNISGLSVSAEKGYQLFIFPAIHGCPRCAILYPAGGGVKSLFSFWLLVVGVTDIKTAQIYHRAIERPMGVEPTSPAWKAAGFTLSHRISKHARVSGTLAKLFLDRYLSSFSYIKLYFTISVHSSIILRISRIFSGIYVSFYVSQKRRNLLYTFKFLISFVSISAHYECIFYKACSSLHYYSICIIHFSQ